MNLQCAVMVRSNIAEPGSPTDSSETIHNIYTKNRMSNRKKKGIICQTRNKRGDVVTNKAIRTTSPKFMKLCQ